MKPHPRIRKTIKWGGAVVTVLLVVVWVGSGWWTITTPRGGVGRGTFLLKNLSRHGRLWSVDPLGGTPKWKWWLTIETYDPGEWRVFLPIWFAVGPVWFATVAAWQLDALARRRARMNLCAKCGYDRTGLAIGAKCPECGAVPETPAVRS